MEAICSSETSGDFQRTTRRYIPEDDRYGLDDRGSIPGKRIRFLVTTVSRQYLGPT
jgi:hypothetical protein